MAQFTVNKIQGPVSREPRKVFGTEKPTLKVLSEKTKRFLDSKRCISVSLSVKPAGIKSSVHLAFHGF